MSEAVIPLAPRREARARLGAQLRETGRREASERKAGGMARPAQGCLVECCPFPRVSAGRGWRVGFARECSATGLRLELDLPHPAGSLLRVVVRDADGRATADALARVRSCWERGDGVCLDLELVETAPASGGARRSLARVRPAAPEALHLHAARRGLRTHG